GGGGGGEGIGGALASLHGVAGRLHVEKSQPAVLANREAGDRVVAAVGSEQEAAIGREDDAAGTLEGVRGALLTTDRLEHAGTGAARRDPLELGDGAVGRSQVMDHRIAYLVGLYVQMAA